MIRFSCPGCSATFTVGDEKAGKTGKCPKCQSQFVIPASEAAEPPPADAPTPAKAPSRPSLSPMPPPPPVADPPTPVEIAPCPKCDTRLSVLPTDIGVDIQCPSCETVFKALRADTPPPPGPGGKSKGSSALVKLGSGSNRDDEDDEDDRPSKRKSKRRDDDDEDDRPSKRKSSRRDDDEDEDRPSRRRSSRRDDDEDDEDDRPSRRRSSRRRDDDDYPSKPSQIQTLGIFLLIGGIIACLYTVGLGLGTYCLWPGAYYELVFGIMAIVKGSQLLGQKVPPTPPRGLLIMAIITIINCDVLNLVFGIVGLTMLSAPEVVAYYNRR